MPGASVASRRSSGRSGSDSSSSVRSVVLRVNRSATGRTSIARAADARALMPPRAAECPMPPRGSPADAPDTTAASAYTPATIAIET